MPSQNGTMKPRKDKGARERSFRERLDTAADARRAMLERLRAKGRPDASAAPDSGNSER